MNIATGEIDGQTKSCRFRLSVFHPSIDPIIIFMFFSSHIPHPIPNPNLTMADKFSLHPQTHRFASSSTQQQQQQQKGNSNSHYFLWLSDIHFDPNYSTPNAYRYPDGRYDATANCTSLNASTVKAFGMHGCDSPLALIQSTLDAAITYISSSIMSGLQSPDFILVTGDVVRHGTTNYQSARQILSTLASEMTVKFPNVEIIYAVGNNDVVPDYYLRLPSDEVEVEEGDDGAEDEPTGRGGGGGGEAGGSDDGGKVATTALDANVHMLEVIYNSLIGQESPSSSTISTKTSTATTSMISTRQTKNAILTPNDRNTFLTGGYYSRYLHSDNSLLVLSMNTVLYSAILEPPRKSDDADPGMQFSWMRAMLASCRNSNGDENGGSRSSGGGCRAIIAGHIPPTVGSYKFNQLWKEEYVRT